MAPESPLWRAPRIHGELKILGIAISERMSAESCERSADRQLRLRRRLYTITCATPFQRIFKVPTITTRVLFALIVLEHGPREVLHFNVTEHPTAAWSA